MKIYKNTESGKIFVCGLFSLTFNDVVYYYPTEEKLLELGFTLFKDGEYTELSLKEKYDNLVIYFIRKRYTENEESAIVRKKLADIDVDDEFTEFNTYCEQCKTDAREELGLNVDDNSVDEQPTEENPITEENPTEAPE